jgi:hypothetical protein
VVVEKNLLMMNDHYSVQKHWVVLQVFDHEVAVVETRMNEVELDENVMVVVEWVVIANYRFEMEVMMVEYLRDPLDLRLESIIITWCWYDRCFW